MKVAIKFFLYTSFKSEDEEVAMDSVNPKPDKQLGCLCVSIKEAFELPEMSPHGCTDATVKVYLLPKRGESGKKKTAIVKGSNVHVWNEEFEYKFVSFEDLKTNRVLEMTVWDYDQRGCNDFIGCLRLGPNPSGGKEWMDSLEEEVKPWEEMLDHPGESVECCLDLIPSIRNLLTSKSCAPNRTQVASGSDANGREDSLLVPIPRDSDGESASHTPTHATLLENHEEDDSEEVCTEILYHLALHMHMII